MAVWTDEDKASVISKYKAAKPTAETSTEIIKEIAEELGQSVNGVRMILVTAKEYIKKDPTATATKAAKEGGTRVSKETQINSLRDILKDNGAEVNDEILDKLTGKAAEYFVSVIKTISSED